MEDMQFVGLELCNRGDVHYRRIEEDKWIKDLSTTFPNGLNKKGCPDGHKCLGP
jgi:hypothetical protein